MESQHLFGKGPLLDEAGNLCERGFSFALDRDYNRAAITASKWRIKEWDYYYVGNTSYGIALTVDDNGYMGMASISLLDFRGKKPFDYTKSPIQWFPFGSVKLPSSSKEGDVVYEKKGFSMKFLHLGNKRRLLCSMDRFGPRKERFFCDIWLEETMDGTMVIATPFEKDGHFYYNQKINCQKASGYAKLGRMVYDFNDKSYGVLDWGRGVWTYKNTWYWCSVNTEWEGKPIGWNLGYGFGDTSKASENMFFYDGKAYKLEDVRMDIPVGRFGGDDFLQTWTFRSRSGDIAMKFKPVYDRHSDTNVLLIRSNQHQVFGLFSGSIETDGRRIEFQDLPGFAEKVYNKW